MPPDPRDLEFLREIESPEERAVVEASLDRHRRADRLAPGDPVPDLTLRRLESPERVRLAGPRSRPLALFFGSYT